MTTPIPMPLRAAAGLAAVAIDEARRLPSRLVGLPVLAMGTALQVSLKAQQRYAELVARGDQLLGQLRGSQEGTPTWARFDEDEDGPSGRPPSAFDSAGDSAFDSALDAVGDDVVDGAGLVADPAGYPAEVDVVDGPGPAGDPAGDLIGLDPITVAAADGDGPVLGSVDPIDPIDAVGAAAEIGVLADDPSRYEEYLPSPPLPGYDEMSIPQLRARLRALSERQLVELIGYERAAAARPPYLTMLENRLATVRGR